MPAKRSMNSGQKEKPSASHQKAYRNGQQQQMDEPTTSSTAIKEEVEENSSFDSEEEITDEDDESNDENEPMKTEEEEEDDEELEMFPPENVDGNAQKKPQKLERLIHTRQLLEGVLCPWEKIQQFIQMCPNHYWILVPGCSVKKCLVAFHVEGRGDDEMIYFDQIKEVFRGTIRFEHYGTFEIDSIQPHYGPIGDEDFGKWLDKLIRSGEELPNTASKFEARKQFLNFLNDLISGTICGRIQQNPKMLFDGMVDQIDEQVLEPPLGMDISPIILHPNQFYHLLKLPRPEFKELMIGLYLKVKISEITHSMKLPPLMTLLDHMLIPISKVTLNAPNHYKVPRLPKQLACNVMVHVKDAKGDVICSTQLPREMKLRSEELIQTSLAIWRMNDIPLPIFDNVHQKSKQLDEAFVSIKKIVDRHEGTFFFHNKNRVSKRTKRKNRQKAMVLEMRASIGIEGIGNDGPKQEIWQQNVQQMNCQMPPNFAKIILKPALFSKLDAELTDEQFRKLVIGMFVHVRIPVRFKLYSVFDLKGHLIVPIAGLSFKRKRGKHITFIHFPRSIKLSSNKGILREKVRSQQIVASCDEDLIKECAMILNTCKIEPPTEEFIAQKEQELCRWL